MPDVPSSFSWGTDSPQPSASHQPAQSHLQSWKKGFSLRAAISNLSIHLLPLIQHARQTKAVSYWLQVCYTGVGILTSAFWGENPNPNHACFKLLSPLQTVNTNSWELRRELPEHSPVLQVSCRSCYCRSLESAAPGVSWQFCSAELRKISPHPSCTRINLL